MSPFIEVGAALIGGAIGKKVGKPSKIDSKPLHKVLAPLASILVGYGVTLLSGGEATPAEAIQTGTTIGLSAIGVYSAAKNLWQLIFKK